METGNNVLLDYNNDNQKLKTLFTLCIEYIASNIFLVESLQDFPDLIGEKIYQQCLTTNCFSETTSANEHVIQLFADAYGRDFIDSLSIRSQRLIVEFSECLSIMCMPVTRLDLRDCLLGNNSEIIKLFGQMNNLRVLNLANNVLSEDGFRSILARHKMYKTGFQALESLDISENTANLRVLKSILSLPCLKSLRISIASSIKSSNTKLTQQWTDIVTQKGFKASQTNEEVACGITNEGWGTKIINTWENKVAEWEIQRLQKVDKKAQSFYSNTLKRARLELKKPRIDEAEHYDTYTYVRSSTNNSSMNDKHQPGIKSKDGLSSKATEGSLSRGRDEGLPMSSQNNTSDFEMELLRMYMKK